MTDLEMTRLCAEAMEYALTRRAVGPWEHDEDGRPTYNPIYNDAQAMALVKKLNLACSTHASTFWVVTDRYGSNMASNKDLNRAIVECVAKMRRKA